MTAEQDDMIQPVHYDGRPVALAGPRDFWLTHSIEVLPPGDPDKRMVVLMCEFAREVLAGALRGPYTDDRAARFARETLIREGEFLLHRDETDVDLALRFKVPLREVLRRRDELERHEGSCGSPR